MPKSRHIKASVRFRTMWPTLGKNQTACTCWEQPLLALIQSFFTLTSNQSREEGRKHRSQIGTLGSCLQAYAGPMQPANPSNSWFVMVGWSHRSTWWFSRPGRDTHHNLWVDEGESSFRHGYTRIYNQNPNWWGLELDLANYSAVAVALLLVSLHQILEGYFWMRAQVTKWHALPVHRVENESRHCKWNKNRSKEYVKYVQ